MTRLLTLTLAAILALAAVPAHAIELTADHHGFHLNAYVNGMRTWFQVDTGADGVVLTYQDAISANVRFINVGSSTVADGSSITHFIGIADLIAIDGVWVKNLRVTVSPSAFLRHMKIGVHLRFQNRQWAQLVKLDSITWFDVTRFVWYGNLMHMLLDVDTFERQ
jgi:predicted aspartyl protease